MTKELGVVRVEPGDGGSFTVKRQQRDLHGMAELAHKPEDLGNRAPGDIRHLDLVVRVPKATTDRAFVELPKVDLDAGLEPWVNREDRFVVGGGSLEEDDDRPPEVVVGVLGQK